MQMNLFDFICNNTTFKYIFWILPVKKQVWFEKKEKIKIGPNLYYFGIFSCNFVFITDRILSRDFKMKTPIFLKLILYALLDYSMWMKTDGFILKQKSQQ